MKRLQSGQLLNIIFILLVVGAALAIYFLSRAQTQSSGEAAVLSAASQASAAPEENAATPGKHHRGVPESVWLTHLQSTEIFTSIPVSESGREWSISFSSDPSVSAQLSYTAYQGYVSSVELVFALPEEYDADSESSIERYLASAESSALSARDEAVRALLADVLPACDANDTVPLSTILLWADSATQIEDADDDFSDDKNGVLFLAYRTQRKDADLLICSFFLDS